MNSYMLSEAEVQKINDDCQAALNQVTWNNNADLDNCYMIKQAIQLARDGFDGGPTAIEKFKPKDANYNSWMDYVHLVTVHYNRGKLIKKYTILRTKILNMRLQKLHLWIVICI